MDKKINNLIVTLKKNVEKNWKPILSVVIILSILYLIIRFLKSGNTEYFSPNSDSTSIQSSSTLFKSTVDKDELSDTAINTNTITNMNNQLLKNKIVWNGYWKNYNEKNEPQYFAGLVQNNDQVILTMNYVSVKNSMTFPTPTSSDYSLNQFIGICQLNYNRNFWVLKKIISNTISADIVKSTKIGFIENKLIGYFDENNNLCIVSIDYNAATVIRDDTSVKFIFSKYSEMKSDTNTGYLDASQIASSLPLIGDTTFTSDPNLNLCQRIYPNLPQQSIYQCTVDGVNSKIPVCATNSEYNPYIDSENEPEFNKICTITNPSDILCSFDAAKFGTYNGTTLSQCSFDNVTINQQTSFSPIIPLTNSSVFNGLTDTNGKIYYNNICNVFNNMNNASIDNYLILHVDKLNTMRSLGYEFFGVKEDESYLTLNETKISIPFKRFFMNSVPNFIMRGLDISKLSYYNSILFSADKYDKKMVANIIPTGFSDFLSFIDNNKSFKKPFKPDDIKTYPNPQPWNIIPIGNSTSCAFRLKSIEINKQIEKFPQFNNNNTTTMSLEKDGINQALVMEDFNLIPSGTDNNMFICSGNLKTNHSKYLSVGDRVLKGLNNGIVVSLKDKPDFDGKWIVIGYNSKAITNIYSTLANITSGKFKFI